MTKTSLYTTNSILTWIAFIAVVCFFVATQNSSNAYWTVDLNSARDSVERGCFSDAKASYNVAFGPLLPQYTAAVEAAETVYEKTIDEINARDDQTFVIVDREGALTDYQDELTRLSVWFTRAVQNAASDANDAVTACRQDTDKRIQAAAKARAEREKERDEKEEAKARAEAAAEEELLREREREAVKPSGGGLRELLNGGNPNQHH